MINHLSKKQSDYLYKSSYLFLCSFLYAIYRKQYNLAIVPGSVFLTSICYWKDPDNLYKRYLDMSVVHLGVIYQHSMVYNAEYATMYYTIFLIGVLFYPIGIYYKSRGDHWKSTYAHMLLHAFGNIGNIVVYSGSNS